MDNEERLLTMRKLANDYLIQSRKIIEPFVPSRLSTVFERWLPKRRMMDPAIFINRAMCDLECSIFGDRELEISVFAGSTAAISDDLLDYQLGIDYDKLLLLGDYKETEDKGELGLFSVFNQRLTNSLPSNFRDRFNKTIVEYNRAQRDSKKLLDTEITREEIVDTKNRAGGYSILLLHAMIYPEESVNITCPDYRRVPSTKQEALYNYGAWLSRVDDLWDIDNDVSKGMKQLATEGIILWETLQEETERMKSGLKFHYSSERVEEMILRHYSPLIDRKIFAKYGGIQ
jgi:hypothetical protein